MMRRFFTNLQVNLAAGYLLFFFSERLFWTIFKPRDRILDLVITWLAYSVLACVFLSIQKRFGVTELARMALAGAVYGWLAEGALVGTLYGTEASAPFPLSIVVTALSWHMLISVLVGWHFLTGSVRLGLLRRTAMISAAVGLFWAAWAPFQWRETPPVIAPLPSFFAHAMLTGACLALACGILSGETFSRCKPGWFGLGLSALLLAVFYSEQVKTIGMRAVILLPLLIGFTLASLHWTKGNAGQPPECVSAARRWKCAAAIMAMPLIASAFYAFQTAIPTRGISPAWIFHCLAVVGAIIFCGACVSSINLRWGRKQQS